MGAEEVNDDEGTERIDEERKEDVGGGLNEELIEVEEDLKGMEFDDTEGHGSVIVDTPVEVGNFQLHLGDAQFVGGLDGMVILNHGSGWWWFGGHKPTRRSFIFILAGFSRIVGVRTSMNNPLVVLVWFGKAPCKWNRFRGLGGVLGSFSSIPILLFQVLEELAVGSN